MTNNTSVKNKRRNRYKDNVDLNDYEYIRLRLIRLEEEVDRQRRILNVFASLLPGFIKRYKQHKNKSKKFDAWFKGVHEYILHEYHEGDIIPPFQFNPNIKYEKYEVENFKDFCSHSGLCYEDLANYKQLRGSVIRKNEAARLANREDGLGNNSNKPFIGEELIKFIEENINEEELYIQRSEETNQPSN